MGFFFKLIFFCSNNSPSSILIMYCLQVKNVVKAIFFFFFFVWPKLKIHLFSSFSYFFFISFLVTVLGCTEVEIVLRILYFTL